MRDILELVLSHLRMMWLYRWVALSCASVVAVAGWLVVLALPNQYEVKAKIFIDTRSMLAPLLQGMVVGNSLASDSSLLLRRTLLTRPNLEQVARRTDMDLSAQTPQAFDRLISKLGSDIRISAPRGEDIYTVAYRGPDPKLAKRVVDELLNTFFESALGGSRQDRTVAERFLDDQIAAHEERLIEGEEKIKAFKQKHMGMLPGTGADYFGRRAQARGQLEQAKLELQEATERRDSLRRQVEAVRSGNYEVLAAEDGEGSPLDPTELTPEMERALIESSSPEVMQINARIQGMLARLDELLLQYTDKHPDIINLRDLVGRLEERKEEVIADLPPLQMTGPDGRALNPLLESLTLNLSEAEANVAALQSRVSEYQSRLEQATAAATTTLELEAEYRRLDRNYNLFKSRYDQLVKSREAARMTQQAAQASNDSMLKMLEPPRMPLSPVGPNRPLLLSGVFAGSIGVALGLAFLLAQINPRMFTRQEVQQVAGLPILGAVTLVANRWRLTEKRMELAFFGLVFMVLAAFYGGLLTLQLMNVDLHGYLSRVIQGIA